VLTAVLIGVSWDQLTPAGRRTLRSASGPHLANLATAFRDFTPDEVMEFERLPRLVTVPLA
jgi:hypothetical protein